MLGLVILANGSKVMHMAVKPCRAAPGLFHSSVGGLRQNASETRVVQLW